MSCSPYVRIAESLDQGPLTAPRAGEGFSPAFIEFLKLLFSEEEAALVQHLPVSRKDAKTAAEVGRLSGRTSDEVRGLLDPLFARGLVIGLDDVYSLPAIPSFLNYHQHRPEVGPDDIRAARLYKEFFVKDGYYRYYEGSRRGTQVARVIPIRKSIKFEEKILDTEEAHEIIEAVDRLRLVPCPCRTRTEKLGSRGCADRNPVGFCIMMGSAAHYFQHLGWGRQVTAAEAKCYFDEMQAHGLVGTTDNFVHSDHSVICLCCGCCCSQIGGRTLWDNPEAVAPANFVASSGDDCIACGLCGERCPFGAIAVDGGLGKSVIDADSCMGCGVCTYVCQQQALSLVRVERHVPLADARELYRRIWIENHDKRSDGR